MNLNCTTGPATRPCTSLWSQGVYRSRSFSLSSTTATARGNALTLPQFSMSMSNDADPLSRLTGDLTQRIRKMHVGASVVAALSNCPTLIQRLTHTDPLSLAVRGAYTQARPDSPHVSRSVTTPKSCTTELRAGGCPNQFASEVKPTLARRLNAEWCSAYGKIARRKRRRKGRWDFRYQRSTDTALVTCP